jgi:dGTPase
MTVRYGDRIAYLTHDALDAIRAGVLAEEDIPQSARDRFGPPGRQWIAEMINAVIAESLASGEVRMDGDTLNVMNELRDFMFANVYLSADQRAHTEPAVALIRRLVDYHLEHPSELPDSYRDEEANLTTQVVDYVAGMTDRYAVVVDEKLFGPQPDSQLALIGSSGSAARID